MPSGSPIPTDRPSLSTGSLLMRRPRTARGRSTCGESPGCRRQSRTTWHPATGVPALHRAGITSAGDGVNVGTARIQRSVHVGNFPLHELEGADRLTKLLTL